MKDSFWFQHDSNARTDARILELRAEMGWQGYGLWWALVEKLREATDYQLSNTIIGGLAMDLALSKSEARAFLDICIVVGLLAVEDDCFYAPALRRRMERWDTKRSALSDAGRRGAGKRWAGDKPTDSQAIATPLATPLATPIARREENIREENRTFNNVPPPPERLVAAPNQMSAELAARLATLTDTSGELRWDASLLTKPVYFAKVARKLVADDTDMEHYRRAALIVAEADDTHRSIKGWESWVAIYFTNQLQRGPLLKMQAGGGTLPTHATPDSQYPPLGQEQAGQVFYITGVHDQSHDRMYATSRLNKWPTATIVSLTHPAGAYTMQDGQVIRK